MLPWHGAAMWVQPSGCGQLWAWLTAFILLSESGLLLEHGCAVEHQIFFNFLHQSDLPQHWSPGDSSVCHLFLQAARPFVRASMQKGLSMHNRCHVVCTCSFNATCNRKWRWFWRNGSCLVMYGPGGDTIWKWSWRNDALWKWTPITN